MARQEEQLKNLEDDFKVLKESLEKEEKLRKVVEDNNDKLIRGETIKKKYFFVYEIFVLRKK